jgi:hypothetical protein
MLYPDYSASGYRDVPVRRGRCHDAGMSLPLNEAGQNTLIPTLSMGQVPENLGAEQGLSHEVNMDIS